MTQELRRNLSDRNGDKFSISRAKRRYVIEPNFFYGTEISVTRDFVQPSIFRVGVRMGQELRWILGRQLLKYICLSVGQMGIQAGVSFLACIKIRREIKLVNTPISREDLGQSL